MAKTNGKREAERGVVVLLYSRDLCAEHPKSNSNKATDSGHV